MRGCFVQARKLDDGAIYIVSLHDCAPSGIQIQAYNQDNSVCYSLGPSEAQLLEAGFVRTREGFQRLVDSLRLESDPLGRPIMVSTLPGIQRPKHVPQGDDAKAFINGQAAGQQTLPELLTTALTELCRAKPTGLEAVRWLGEWLLANNPNKPRVEFPDDAAAGAAAADVVAAAVEDGAEAADGGEAEAVAP